MRMLHFFASIPSIPSLEECSTMTKKQRATFKKGAQEIAERDQARLRLLRADKSEKMLKPILCVAPEKVSRSLREAGLAVTEIDPASSFTKMAEKFTSTRPSMILSMPGASQSDVQEYFWFLETLANTGVAVLHLDSQFNDR